MIARGLSFLAFGLLALLAVRLESDHRPAPLRQWAYVWQREWTPPVSAAVRQAGPHLDGFVVLGAEVSWKEGTPHVLRPHADWAALRETGKPLGIALRIDPFDAVPQESRTRLFTELAKSLVAEARQNGVPCTEFQVDFDCAERKLAAYRAWLPALRDAVQPVRFVITTLPAWFDDEPEMARLVAEADGFILQVHSVPTREQSDHVGLFDPQRAQRWVARAAKLGRPFTVSLPTYSALVGYDSHGQSLGMALDGVQPSWPAGTRVVEFSSDAGELGRQAAAWRTSRPANMEGVTWYRLPIGGSQRNWRWPTFAAVLDGREPEHHLEPVTNGDSPIDLSLTNTGEAEEPLRVAVVVRWEGPADATADALPGWTVSQADHEFRFARTETSLPRLLPGGRREIGWLRFNQPTHPYAEILR